MLMPGAAPCVKTPGRWCYMLHVTCYMLHVTSWPVTTLYTLQYYSFIILSGSKANIYGDDNNILLCFSITWLVIKPPCVGAFLRIEILIPN